MPILAPTIPIIIPIFLPLSSDFSVGFDGLVGELVELVAILVGAFGNVGSCSGSNCVTHVKFLISRI